MAFTGMCELPGVEHLEFIHDIKERWQDYNIVRPDCEENAEISRIITRLACAPVACGD